MGLFFLGAIEVVIKFIWNNKHAEISGKTLKRKEKEQWVVEDRPHQIVKHMIKPQKLKCCGISTWIDRLKGQKRNPETDQNAYGKLECYSNDHTKKSFWNYME